jgi:hypothetical protein
LKLFDVETIEPFYPILLRAVWIRSAFQGSKGRLSFVRKLSLHHREVAPISYDLIHMIDAHRTCLNACEAGVTTPEGHRIHDVTSYLRVSGTA